MWKLWSISAAFLGWQHDLWECAYALAAFRCNLKGFAEKGHEVRRHDDHLLVFAGGRRDQFPWRSVLSVSLVDLSAEAQMLFLATILASMSLNTTRSAARSAISSSDRQSASWQESADRKNRLEQVCIGHWGGFLLSYALGVRNRNKKEADTCFFFIPINAGNGTWTHTVLPPTDFESASSAIPTRRHSNTHNRIYLIID